MLRVEQLSLESQAAGFLATQLRDEARKETGKKQNHEWETALPDTECSGQKHNIFIGLFGID